MMQVLASVTLRILERSYGVSAGKRNQIEIFFKKKFLSKIDVDLIIWSRTFIISKKNFLSIWSLFPALTPFCPIYFQITYSMKRYIRLGYNIFKGEDIENAINELAGTHVANLQPN